MHCGDGTSKIFYEDDRVLYVSIHRYDDGSFYPAKRGSPKYLGRGKGFGYNIQFGYNNYSEEMIGDLDYAYACEMYLFPLIKNFAPEAIIISCGFDSALGDSLGGIGLTPTGYAWMTHGLTKICPHIISLLEGGYDLDSLAKCSEGVLRSMFIHGEDDVGFSKLLKFLKSPYTSYQNVIEAALKKPRGDFTKLIEQLKNDINRGERPEDEP